MNLYPPLPDIEDLLQSTVKISMHAAAPDRNLAGLGSSRFGLLPGLQFCKVTARKFSDPVTDWFQVSRFAQALAQSAAEPIPALLQARFRRQASSQFPKDQQAQAGQLRWLIRLGETTPPHPICYMLNQPTEGEYWSAWLVAPEADYASDRDVLLEEIDSPLDPIARMVQTWNIAVLPGSAGQAIGQLPPERLAQVRSVASGTGTSEQPRPGRIHLWPIGNGSVLCGTPLGDATDPRHTYQQIYRELAAKIARLYPPFV